MALPDFTGIPGLLMMIPEETRVEPGDTLTTTGSPSLWPEFINMMAALLFVLALLLALAWLVQRFGGKRFPVGGGGMMQLIASLPLGEKRFISVVRVGSNYHLVGITNNSITKISDIDIEDIKEFLPDPDKPGQAQVTFSAFLKRMMNRDSGGES